MIEINALRYTKDRRCASCAHCVHDGIKDFDDVDIYKCDLFPTGADCESVRKHLCLGKKFRNKEPINKLFPKMPINVITITQKVDHPFRLNHIRAASLVMGLSLGVFVVRSLVGW
jgi:hypothetical protein